ncbi:MAG: FadR family transcriptional regulator [Clostridia bacterium]|nr:FadR family transcriptional regulator [Clostridia bacterium]
MQNSYDNSRYYEAVIVGIENMITNGELKPGDKLPSERKLAEQFNVSRVPVREALKILEYNGVIDCSQGSGTYISKKKEEKVNLLDLPAPSKELIYNFLSLRIALESYAAYEAAKNRTDDDITEMQNTILHIRELRKKDDLTLEEMQSLRNQSQYFHQCIVNASHNSILIAIYESLGGMLKLSREYTINTSSYNSLLAHEAILAKIIAKDTNGAQEAMAGHLADVKYNFSKLEL